MSDNVYQMNSRRRPSNYDGGGHGGDMDNLTKRVEQLEKDTHKIQLDLAVLTTRSEEFATKSGLAELVARSEDFATKADIESVRTDHMTLRAEVVKELAASEKRMTDKFENKFDAVNKRLEGINDRLLWTLMIPAIVAILLWFVKEAVLKW